MMANNFVSGFDMLAIINVNFFCDWKCKGPRMAEVVVGFVIEKLLRPIGIDMFSNAFNEDAGNREEA
jgi:hypothetical protein